LGKSDQGAEHHRGRARVVERGMRGRDVEGELLDEPRQARGLALGELQHEPRQGRGVDDRVLERALKASTDEPGVERVVAVLDQHSALSEAQEGSARVAKLWCADQHRAVDVMTPVRVRVDRRAAVHKRVEEGERAVEPEALRANLQDQKRCVSGGLDVQGDELRLIQDRLVSKLGCVHCDLFPRHELHGTARFEEERFHPRGLLVGAHRASARARRAQPISSLVTPRSRRTAPP
jgi:hypothetical protein